MKYKVGFIGCGNMASAIIGGLKAHAGIDASEIIAADASEAAREKAKETLSICTTASNTEVSTQAERIILIRKTSVLRDGDRRDPTNAPCRADHRYDRTGQDTGLAWRAAW